MKEKYMIDLKNLSPQEIAEIVATEADKKQTLQTLDDPKLYASVVREALNIGLLHISLGEKPINSEKLLDLLGNKFGQFRYRRFHATFLRMAYGSGYSAIAKVKWAKSKGY